MRSGMRSKTARKANAGASCCGEPVHGQVDVRPELGARGDALREEKQHLQNERGGEESFARERGAGVAE